MVKKTDNPKAPKDNVEKEQDSRADRRQNQGCEGSISGKSHDVLGMEADTANKFQLNKKEESSIPFSTLGRSVNGNVSSEAEGRAVVVSVEVSESIFNQDVSSGSGFVGTMATEVFEAFKTFSTGGQSAIQVCGSVKDSFQVSFQRRLGERWSLQRGC
ncbi:hypothetical protein ACOSP7_023949 [Xanthoceras sorbifolium]